MRSYDERSDGDGFADLYDEWSAHVTDADDSSQHVSICVSTGATHGR
jgi:hypothetical protein